MNARQRRKLNRWYSRLNLRIVRSGGLVPCYGFLSHLEHRELKRVAIVRSFGDDGLCYCLETTWRNRYDPYAG